MKISICPICTIVSGAWLGLSAGVAWGYLVSGSYLVPIALLMGGTVVGIVYQGERRFTWAARNPISWKLFAVFLGMALAYLAVTNLEKWVVVAEIIVIFILANFFFVKRSLIKEANSSSRISEIEEQMKQCC